MQELNNLISKFLLTDQSIGKFNFPNFENHISEYEILLRRNIVLRRFVIKNQNNNNFIPEELFNISNSEMARINNALIMINALSNLCNHHNIPYVMTKAFQHYPDMGHDIDLLIMDNPSNFDNILKIIFEYKYRPVSLSSYIAGKRAYLLSDCDSPIEVHNNSLGHFGEYKDYAEKVVERRIAYNLNDISTFIPSIEDQLIIQCIQRIYGHRTVRISDVMQVSKLINSSSFNWEYTLSTISDNGIKPGFSHYMSVINNLCIKWNIKPFEANKYISKIIKSNSPMPKFNGSVYMTTSFVDLGIIYIKNYLFNILNMKWGAIYRLSFLPVVALSNGLRNILKKVSN